MATKTTEAEIIEKMARAIWTEYRKVYTLPASKIPTEEPWISMAHAAYDIARAALKQD